MIDFEKIKALPDDKPRKGPHRMSKSEKSSHQERWKHKRSFQRLFGLERYDASQETSARIAEEVEQILRDVEESLDP